MMSPNRHRDGERNCEREQHGGGESGAAQVRRNNVVAIAGTAARTLIIPLDIVETTHVAAFEVRHGYSIELAIRDFLHDEIFNTAATCAPSLGNGPKNDGRGGND